MPEIDGLTAASIIRSLPDQQSAKTPIIALTASVMKEDQQDCIDAGMNAIVGKPIDFSDLLSTVERFVGEGQGKVRDEQTFVPLTGKTDIDFSPLNSIVNCLKYPMRLRSWNYRVLLMMWSLHLIPMLLKRSYPI